MARRHALVEEARKAEPPPLYPHELRPGTPTGDYVEMRVHGALIRADLHAPYITRQGVRPRCDQFAIVIDGEQWAAAAGLVALFDELRKRLPRAMSRHAIASMER